MKTRAMTVCVAATLILAVSGAALGDWDLGDGHKMHYPQLPDQTGWDVDVTTDTVYDDFQCSWTGPIDDFHFWVSWERDMPSDIIWIDVSIHGDVPATQSGMGFSHPDSLMYGDPLWKQTFLPGQWMYRPYGQGDQGWLSPEESSSSRPDHMFYDQINITNIDNPFIQEKDTIYWVGLHIGVADPQTAIGWKTTQDHWNDDATYYYGGGWNELIDPLTQESLDMAFVITPEPVTLCLLGLGGLGLLRRRR